MPTLERFEDWVHQSMRDPVSHFPQLSNEETWKVLLFYSKSTVICCRSWSVVCPTSSWRRATGSSRCTTTTGMSTMWFLCLKTLRWRLHTLSSFDFRVEWTDLAGVDERVPRAFVHASQTHALFIQWFNNSVNFCRSWRRVAWTGATDMGLASLESVSAILDLTEITAARVSFISPLLLHFLLLLQSDYISFLFLSFHFIVSLYSLTYKNI